MQLAPAADDLITLWVRRILGLWFIAFGILKPLVPSISEDWQGQLDQSGFPLPGAMFWLGAAFEVAAGLALLSRRWARVGAGMVVVAMVAAVYVHFTVDADLLPMDMTAPLLPLIAGAMALWVLLKRDQPELTQAAP